MDELKKREEKTKKGKLYLSKKIFTCLFLPPFPYLGEVGRAGSSASAQIQGGGGGGGAGATPPPPTSSKSFCCKKYNLPMLVFLLLVFGRVEGGKRREELATEYHQWPNELACALTIDSHPFQTCLL